jgi:hypothetical protein
MTENECFWLDFVKTGSINSGTGKLESLTCRRFRMRTSEPEFVNVYEAQKLILRNRLRQDGIDFWDLKRFTNAGAAGREFLLKAPFFDAKTGEPLRQRKASICESFSRLVSVILYAGI